MIGTRRKALSARGRSETAVGGTGGRLAIAVVHRKNVVQVEGQVRAKLSGTQESTAGWNDREWEMAVANITWSSALEAAGISLDFMK